MASTNFGALLDEQYTRWARLFWRETKNQTFIMGFAGDNSNSMIHRVKELRNTTDGARAVITLINNSVGDGVVGDNTLDGNEEALGADDRVITLDQWRHAHKRQGVMADQETIVNFRKEAKISLAYRRAEVEDELAFLTMSGVGYGFHTDGRPRIASQLPLLKYASDVRPPSANRHVRWSASSGLVEGDTSAITPADTPTWEMLVNLKAFAVNNYVPQLRAPGGVLYYNVFMTPTGIAKLKMDEKFLQALRSARERGTANPIWKGTPHGGTNGMLVDGLNILEYRHVYNTSRAPAGQGWGPDGNVKSQRVLLCGAQALAYADIDAYAPFWREQRHDYENVLGIAVGKIGGLLKPQFHSTYTGTDEDFGIVACDTAI